MESVKKWLSERQNKKNGIFIHSSPPKLFGTVSSIELRQWARSGAENKLERAILAGQGHRLLAEAEALPLSRHLYNLIVKCDSLHSAVEKGSLLQLKELLEPDYNRNKYVMCCDEAGVGLLHKAVYNDYIDIVEYLVTNYPQLVHQRDSEGRTALHYTAACREEAATAALLEKAGAARGARDAAGRTLAHYRAARTSLALPARADNMPTKPQGLVVKRHNIRIWCHECDLGRLQRVVWEGQGSRLLSEVSSQQIVKKFLEAVPYIMNTIRDIHDAVIQNNLESVMKLSGDPVPPQILSSRDANNMTVMHKAAGLGHNGILKYLIERYPQGINDIDNEGRTPLHYAAGVRDDQHTYKTLVSSGADESAVDNKNKTPGYYVNRAPEIDKNIFKSLPEAPRTPSSAYPSSWDWKILDTEFIGDFNKKSRKKILRASNENISSKNNTNTLSENTESHVSGMKGSSTHEIISNLPDLDENEKPNITNGNNKHEHDNDQVTDDDKNEQNHLRPDEISENEKNDEHSQIDNIENNKEDISQANDTQVDCKDEDDSKIISDADVEDKNNEIDSSNVESDKIIDSVVKTTEHEIAHNGHDSEDKHSDKENEQENTEKKKNEKLDEDIHDHINHTEEPEHNHEIVENNAIEEINANDEENVQPTKNKTEDIPSADTETTLENDTELKQNTKNQDDIIKLNEANQNNTGEILTNNLNNKEDEEESNDLLDEGNKCSNDKDTSDHIEDDDDVQVQGSSYPEHNNSNTTSTPTRQTNGSAKRGETNTSSGNLTNGRNIQENFIEGIISSEAEQETLDASISQKNGSVNEDILIVDNEIDPEVTDLINTANMEMLATLVLNGEGSRLIGRRSVNQELQAFLQNVPTYMQKINKVHIAAKDGNLKDLQAALDRRKFAIARDPISPNGATPLHVATVFGKTNIVKYLGGRFPETLSAVDFEGRTALHYAAVLPDNGHYYNLLQQLGANSKDLDDMGRSAEDYYKNPTLLLVDQLLTDFGVNEELAKKMFSDKGISHATNGHTATPIFHTEEGRYLAKCKLLLYLMDNKQFLSSRDELDPLFTALGDPLIKGLTEVANIKPKDPVAFLATFLHNFPEHEKHRVGTQESNLLLTKGGPEVENDNPPPDLENTKMLGDLTTEKHKRSATRTATIAHRPIDVITVDPHAGNSPDAPELATSSADRDEHGQSMLHFAAARTHSNNALLQILQESDVSLGFRDELYRTARDISIQANVLDNTAQIDKYVLQLAARGNTDKIMELLLLGYDHILDVVDDEGVPIAEVIAQRGDNEMNNLLASIPTFEESREALHRAALSGDLSTVKNLVSGEGGRTLVRAHNSFGRTALHAAVLAQKEDTVAYLVETFPELLRIGDNLERTPLHYAMGVDKMETLSHILIKAGAKRVIKDLKGRQPSYYFMNKSEILRLKEEEEAY